MSDIDYKKLPLVELYKLRDGRQGWDTISANAKIEIERRDFWHKFLTHGVVPWLALIVSIVALYISLTK